MEKKNLSGFILCTLYIYIMPVVQSLVTKKAAVPSVAILTFT
jgi:hypothetical protein